MTLLPEHRSPPTPVRRADDHVLHLLAATQSGRDLSPREALSQALVAVRHASQSRSQDLAWALLRAATVACHGGRARLARRWGEVSLEIFKSMGESGGEAGASNLLGVLAHERGDLAAAYGAFTDALLLAERQVDQSFVVSVLGNLAQTAQALGDIESALRWTLRALSLATELGADADRARLLLGSVSLSLSMSLPDQARTHALEGQAITERLGLCHLQASALLARCQVAEHDGRAQDAVDLARLALSRAETHAAPRRELAQVELQLGRVLVQANELNEASDVLQRVMLTAQQLNNPELEVAATTQFAVAQMGHERWALGREMLTRALKLAHHTGCRSELAAAMLTLANLEELAGRPQAALSAFRAYHELDRQLFGERQARLTQNLLVTHEVEQQRRLNAQLEAANRELSFAANHDALTGALNRRAFMQALDSQMAQGGFSLVLFDLDHFKQVNDHFGHGIGDEVLRCVVRICQQTLRESDLVCRWGGEEFAALLPGTDLAGAQGVIERLRAQVQGYPWEQLHAALQVSGSFGLGEWARGENVEGLLSRVDEALYAAKNTGRNRVVVCRIEADQVSVH